VQHAVEDVDETRAALCSFNRHPRASLARLFSLPLHPTTRSRQPAVGRKQRHLRLQLGQLLLELVGLERTLPGECGVVSPPVQPNLLGLVDRAYDQPDSNGKELDL